MQLQIDLSRVNEKYKDRLHTLTDDNLLLQVAVDQLQEQLQELQVENSNLKADVARLSAQASTEAEPASTTD